MKDHLIRQVIPSLPVIARWPVVPRALDAADWVLRRRDPRYASLPPASLRMRIGVSNRILRNADVFLEGHALVGRCVERGWVGEGARILDLGCGVGRNAMGFRERVRFETYDGVDIDAEMVSWCVSHLAGPSMRFHHADLFSTVYNPTGRRVTSYRLPLDDGSITFSLGASVFSHLVSADAAHYAAELGRVTQPRGFACHTFFLLDHIQPLLGDRWTFEHEVDGCWLENPKYPEAAVAFREADVATMFGASGLEILEVLDKHKHQQMVVFRKQA